MFGEYKKSLKRLSNKPGYDWMTVHQVSLRVVTPKMAKNFYRHCGVPLMEAWFKQEEERQRYEKDGEALPYPFNELVDDILDLVNI